MNVKQGWKTQPTDGIQEVNRAEQQRERERQQQPLQREQRQRGERPLISEGARG